MVVTLTKTKSGHEHKDKPHRYTVGKHKGAEPGWEVKHWGPGSMSTPDAAGVYRNQDVTDKGRLVFAATTLDQVRAFIGHHKELHP